ncbi:MAG TPA: hypothetical protein VMF08_19010 [Candidatus Sulfotelmatobacter sp.]|nr:hypothetical protein [Candidatus Sulfotelmatobacter sp.]
MNRKLQLWGTLIVVFALQAIGAWGQSYEFAAVSSNVTAGVNLSAVAAATNGNIFVCVGGPNSPVLSVNTNNFTAFANSNVGGGYLLATNAWNSSPKSNSLDCVTAQLNGFAASGVSNLVYVSYDGVNWTNSGAVLPPGNQSVAITGIAYNPVSATFAAVQTYSVASWTTNPISTNAWQTATLLPPSSFVESFLAIASFDSSNMAMCGILGDVRVSTNGGQTWIANQQPDSIMPNLVAVASDGGTNLVCAGDNSLIEVCTNGGFNGLNAPWMIQTNFNFSAPGSPTNFNAVAYSPVANAFLAAGTVGANGLIIMAPETASAGNWTWTGQTNLWTLQNGSLTQTNANVLAGVTLNGAAVANSGFFQGIAMVVGNNGAVLIGGLPPPAPNNSSGNYVTNILSQPQVNGPLGNPGNIVADPNHPVNVLAMDWYSEATGGVQLETNSPVFLPPGSIYNACGTYTNWAAERDLRTGFSSTNRTPFVFYIVPGPPTDPVNATNCDLSNITGQYGMCVMTNLSVTVVTNAANMPGTNLVNWYDGNSNLLAANTFTPDSDIVTYTPTNLAPNIYTFYAQTTNPATGLASATWTKLTFQLNALPQWTNALPEAYTNTVTNPQTYPVITVPAISNLAQITSIEPAASVTIDWYTNGSPYISTYESLDAFATGLTFNPTNQLCGVYTYYARARVVDPDFTACACQSTNLIPVTFTLLPPAPIDGLVGWTNVLGQANAPIWVDVQTNANNSATNFIVNWYSAPQGSNSAILIDNGSETRSSNRFFHTPTNSTCGIFTNWAETVATNTGSGGSLVSTNRFPVVFAIVPAAPTAIGTTDATNCIEVPNPTFTVAVASGQTASWYAVPSTGTPLTNALSFTPTNSSPGAWEFSAWAVDSGSGLASTGSVLATLSLSNCSSPPVLSFNPAAGTGTIQWQGNLTLLSTTNLAPPVVWTNIATGSNFATPNTFTFTTNAPVQFFRLTN